VPHLANCIFVLFIHWMSQDRVWQSILAWLWHHFHLGLDEIWTHDLSSSLTTRPDFRPWRLPYFQLLLSSRFSTGDHRRVVAIRIHHNFRLLKSFQFVDIFGTFVRMWWPFEGSDRKGPKRGVRSSDEILDKWNVHWFEQTFREKALKLNLITKCVRNLGKLNFIWWFNFTLKPVFDIALFASKSATYIKSGQKWPSKILFYLS